MANNFRIEHFFFSLFFSTQNSKSFNADPENLTRHTEIINFEAQRAIEHQNVQYKKRARARSAFDTIF